MLMPASLLLIIWISLSRVDGMCVPPDDSCSNSGQCATEDAYTGPRSRTVSRRICQRWDTDSPHANLGIFGGDSSRENKCQTGDGEPTPWCYTTDPAVRWEHCFHHCGSNLCTSPDESCAHRGMNCVGLDRYTGFKNTTINGKSCQRWDSQTPHSHSAERQDSWLENFCSSSTDEDSPWCYTTDPGTRWEYCFEDCNTTATTSRNSSCTPATEHCAHEGPSCDELDEYSGPKNWTQNRVPCQPWGLHTPHSHSFLSGDSARQNFCQTGDFELLPWCYTMDPNKRWDYCFEDCATIDPCVAPDATCAYYGTACNGSNLYNDLKSTTISGRTCQRWDVQSPHAHGETPRHAFEENYCITSIGKDAPWCYTTDPWVEWEYCFSDCGKEDGSHPNDNRLHAENVTISNWGVELCQMTIGSVEECEEACIGTTGCGSIQFHAVSSLCVLASGDPTSNPKDFGEHSAFMLFQYSTAGSRMDLLKQYHSTDRCSTCKLDVSQLVQHIEAAHVGAAKTRDIQFKCGSCIFQTSANRIEALAKHCGVTGHDPEAAIISFGDFFINEEKRLKAMLVLGVSSTVDSKELLREKNAPKNMDSFSRDIARTSGKLLDDSYIFSSGNVSSTPVRKLHGVSQLSSQLNHSVDHSDTIFPKNLDKSLLSESGMNSSQNFQSIAKKSRLSDFSEIEPVRENESEEGEDSEMETEEWNMSSIGSENQNLSMNRTANLSTSILIPNPELTKRKQRRNHDVSATDLVTELKVLPDEVLITLSENACRYCGKDNNYYRLGAAVRHVVSHDYSLRRIKCGKCSYRCILPNDVEKHCQASWAKENGCDGSYLWLNDERMVERLKEHLTLAFPLLELPEDDFYAYFHDEEEKKANLKLKQERRTVAKIEARMNKKVTPLSPEEIARNPEGACRFCGKVLPRELLTLALKHIGSHFEQLRPIKCNGCGYRACYPKNLVKYHESSPVAKQYGCDGSYTRSNTPETMELLKKALKTAFTWIKLPKDDNFPYFKFDDARDKTRRFPQFDYSKVDIKDDLYRGRATIMRKEDRRALNQSIKDLRGVIKCELCLEDVRVKDSFITGALKHVLRHDISLQIYACAGCSFRASTTWYIMMHTTKYRVRQECNEFVIREITEDAPKRIRILLQHAFPQMSWSNLIPSGKRFHDFRF